MLFNPSGVCVILEVLDCDCNSICRTSLWLKALIIRPFNLVHRCDQPKMHATTSMIIIHLSGNNIMSLIRPISIHKCPFNTGLPSPVTISLSELWRILPSPQRVVRTVNRLGAWPNLILPRALIPIEHSFQTGRAERSANLQISNRIPSETLTYFNRGG